MAEFKPLELSDMDLFHKYLGEYSFSTYEYTFLTLYIWRKMCNVAYSIIDDALIIKKSTKSTGSYFMQPLGYTKESLKNIVIKLDEIRKSRTDFKSLFRDVELPFINELIDNFGYNICICEDVNNFDYIYSSKQLISLSGRKYHRKKNLYNQFIKKYHYEVRELHDKYVIKDCIDFAEDWYYSREKKDEQLGFELESIKDILANREILNIKGIAVYVDGRIAGFSIGEKANSKMAIVHIEKGNLEYTGIYSFLNKTLVEKYFKDVNFINRQEDLGIAGLRKAKMSYNPVRLEKKFIVDLSL
ncbi:MAG TPA: DUF2156 domain-containing protein [Clostridiaceae bacterium]|nr:DUF2156 domain-containing protein [Clostridiaceae bacterium]